MSDRKLCTPQKSLTLLSPDGLVGWSELIPLPISADSATLECRLVVEGAGERSATVHAEITNTGNAPSELRGIRWTHAGRREHTLKFPASLSPHYLSTENYRSEFLGTGTCIGDSFSSPLLNVTTEIGWSEDQAFPGLFIASTEQPVGLFCAALTQTKFSLLFRLRGRNGKGDWFFEIDEHAGSVQTTTLKPGAVLRGESLFFSLCATSNPQQATGDYENELEARGVFERRKLNPLAEQRIWCTWNYDFFEKITEADILRQLPVIREHFPSVRFIQVDDGYQKEIVPGSRSMIDLVYDGVDPFDPVKFPSGAKGTADKIKAEGFRPAIWLGLWASMASRLVRENPGWILRDDMGRPLIFDQWHGGICVLDASLPEVQDYLERVAATVFGEWGYEGVKLDFSTFAFCGKTNRLRGTLTPLESRQRLLTTFRKHLPKDGFFGWCVVSGTGHPLVGLEADYFRNAEDIGEGDWKIAQRIAAWTLNTNLLMQRRPVFPNIDSVGWSKHFSETEWRSWLNLCAISGAALEISCDLTKLPAERLKLMAQTMQLSDPFRTLACADLMHGTFTHPPSVWVATGPSDRLIALFNWKDEPATIACADVTQGKAVHDAWTGEEVTQTGFITLDAHESVLWRV